MQAGQKLGIVYIDEAGGKVSAETFYLLTCIWSDQVLVKSLFVILRFNLLMFSWSVISVVSQAVHLLDFLCTECSLC